jgi:hypothetical protein
MILANSILSRCYISILPSSTALGGVQLLFRKPLPSDGMVKLTNEEIKWLISRVGSGFFTVKKAAHVYGVTERRV